MRELAILCLSACSVQRTFMYHCLGTIWSVVSWGKFLLLEASGWLCRFLFSLVFPAAGILYDVFGSFLCYKDRIPLIMFSARLYHSLVDQSKHCTVVIFSNCIRSTEYASLPATSSFGTAFLCPCPLPLSHPARNPSRTPAIHVLSFRVWFFLFCCG